MDPVEAPLGPWTADIQAHPEPDHAWTYKKYQCRVRRHHFLFTYCGYIDLMPSHRLYGLSIDELGQETAVRPHGGFTYAQGSTVGFDFAHGGDVIPSMHFLSLSGDNDHYWTFDQVVDHVQSVVDQLCECH